MLLEALQAGGDALQHRALLSDCLDKSAGVYHAWPSLACRFAPPSRVTTTAFAIEHNEHLKARFDACASSKTCA